MISYSQMNAASQPSAAAEPAERLASEVPDPASGLYARPGSERLLYSRLLTELGVRHGFTTRLGGVSSGRFASCNLGRTWGDDPRCADENLRLIAADAGFAVERLCQVIQVHSPRVLLLTAPERRQREADGMASAHSLCLGVLSADCVSILLADGEGRVAAVHAGWRGTVAGVAGAAVTALSELGAKPGQLRAVLGPSIGPCCFEVQADVAAEFSRVTPGCVQQRGGRTYVDLWRTNRELLLKAGLAPEHIDATPPCTHCDPRRFFSYRRDGAGIGQHLAFILGGS
jgi:YfiH family protein